MHNSVSTGSGASPVPVTILTGFLGAGKTTLLNHILSGDHGLRIAVLVNDFGSVNIDSELVLEMTDDTVSLANGCICCTIRDDFLVAIRDLLARPQRPEHILIEASGVSDPLEIALAFRVPDLQALVRVDAILTLIDAEQVLDLERDNQVLAILQVGAADIVLVNKVDLVSIAQLERVREWVRGIIPHARIVETQFAHVPLEIILGVGTYSPDRLQRDAVGVHVHEAGEQHDHHYHTHDLIFDSWTWHSDRPLALKALQRMLKRLPATTYRVKGIVYLADSPDQRGVLQMVGKRATIDLQGDWSGEPGSRVVFIGARGSIDRDKLQEMMTQCLAENVPASQIGRLARAVTGWLRGPG